MSSLGGGGASWLLLLDVVEDMDVVLLLRLREPVELFVLSAKHTMYLQTLVLTSCANHAVLVYMNWV